MPTALKRIVPIGTIAVIYAVPTAIGFGIAGDPGAFAGFFTAVVAAPFADTFKRRLPFGDSAVMEATATAVVASITIAFGGGIIGLPMADRGVLFGALVVFELVRLAFGRILAGPAAEREAQTAIERLERATAARQTARSSRRPSAAKRAAATKRAVAAKKKARAATSR